MAVGIYNMKRKNISQQLVFIMVILGLCFTIVAGTIGVWMSYNREMNQIAKRIQQIETSYVPPLAQSLWVEADEMLRVQLQGISELPDMKYAEIERDDSPYFSFGEKRNKGGHTYSFPIVYAHASGKEKIKMEVGKLNIQIDLKKVYHRLGKNVIAIFINQAFVLFCVASCMLFILKKIIVTPLHILKGSAEKVASGDFDQTIEIGRKDEFNDLAHSLEFMRTTIKAKINELHQANDNLNILNTELKSEIEERKKFEANLRKAEEKYRKIFENAVEGIFQTTPDGALIGVNPTMAKMFGFDSSDAMLEATDNISDYYVFKEARKDFVKQVTQNGKVLNFETQMLDNEQKKFWVSISARLIRGGEENEENLFEGMVMNITARKEREKAEEERKTAEAANRAKSRFLANMSHEIRTPMNAIIGLTDLALRTELTEKQADYLKKISLSANSLLGIINDILDFSKIEAGKLDLENIDFNLNEVLENMAALITLKTEEKGLELIFDIQRDLSLNLVGDPLRLGQVLVNLANNAVKFTEKGQIVIKITTGEGTPDKKESRATLVFSVSDSGIGMTTEEMSKLFKSFSQADSSTTRKFGGTGLGLSISMHLVEMMNGEIWVESELGQGSTFWFTATFGLQSTQPPDSLRIKNYFSGIRVLVVDDNATSREIIVDALKDFSFLPEEASSGAEALEMIQNDSGNTPYELILMDWHMPGMDGVETAKRIKNHPDLVSSPRIIMLTAFGREEVRRRAEAAGIEGFLVKPVNRSILFDSIMNLFGDNASNNVIPERQSFHSQPEMDSFRNVSVLLAEDNELNQQVAVELLEAAGIQVEVVANGRLAVETICRDEAHDTYDMVLMDIQMPEMDGLTATETIRAFEKEHGKEHVPIIAMTAHALPEEKERCRAVGMDAHISKPIDPRLVFSTIKSWLPPEKVSATNDEKASSNVLDKGRIDRSHKVFSETSACDLPDALAGVDLSAGLNRMAGNRELYSRILIKFGRKYRGVPDQIFNAIDQKKIQQAVELTHGIKGIAGNIGAQQVYEAFQQLEIALKKNKPDSYQDLCRNANEQVVSVFAAIDQWVENLEASRQTIGIEENSDGPRDVLLDQDRIRHALEDFRACLSDYNMDAPQYLARLKRLAQGHHREELGEIDELVDELEFDQALEKLKALSEILV